MTYNRVRDFPKSEEDHTMYQELRLMFLKTMMAILSLGLAFMGACLKWWV